MKDNRLFSTAADSLRAGFFPFGGKSGLAADEVLKWPG